MTPRHFKCTQFRKGTSDFILECNQLLQNDFFKQRYITFNATIPDQDRIYTNTHLCRTFFAGYIYMNLKTSWVNCDNQISLKFSSSPVSGAAFRLHQSHESETPIIYQMFHNNETNARLIIGVVTSVWSTSSWLHLIL